MLLPPAQERRKIHAHPAHEHTEHAGPFALRGSSRSRSHLYLDQGVSPIVGHVCTCWFKSPATGLSAHIGRGAARSRSMQLDDALCQINAGHRDVVQEPVASLTYDNRTFSGSDGLAPVKPP